MMNASYLLRLAGLCLASFFLVHALLGLVALASTRFAMRMAEGMRPPEAGRLLLGLRLAPAVVAGFVVLGLCVPSYLWFEPEATPEDMGVLCAGAAFMGLLGWMLSSARAFRALVASDRYARECRLTGLETPACVENAIGMPAVVVDHPQALLTLCGVLRPTLLISSGVLRALSPEQLDVALHHEREHWTARHNFKRLLMLLVPDVVPFRRSFRALESRWARFAEWDADDQAAAGDPVRSLSLAGALVRVAQLGLEPELPLASSLTSGGRDLEARVERLLRADSIASAEPPSGIGKLHCRFFAALALAGCLVMAVSLMPAVLPSIYRLLEDLVH